MSGISLGEGLGSQIGIPKISLLTLRTVSCQSGPVIPGKLNTAFTKQIFDGTKIVFNV